MKSVLISIRPKWCEKIASGEKTVEVRKTRPKLKPPFRCYIYCTKDARDPDKLWVLNKKLRQEYNGLYAACANLDECPERHFAGNGKVIGEFTCDRIDKIIPSDEPYGIYDIGDDYVRQTCLENGALWDYGRGAALYGWHISGLKIYDKPRKLSEFTGAQLTKDGFEPWLLDRAPQSWRYVVG